MPNGIEEIKDHLEKVDNVPLLVSLYTDATPDTVKDMVHIFRGYGETVLSIGSAYRSSNHELFQASNMSCSVAMLPGHTDALHGSIALAVDAVTSRFPDYSATSLCKPDLHFLFELTSIGTPVLLQRPFFAKQYIRNRLQQHVSMSIEKRKEEGEVAIDMNELNEQNFTGTAAKGGYARVYGQSLPVASSRVSNRSNLFAHLSSPFKTSTSSTHQSQANVGSDNGSNSATNTVETAILESHALLETVRECRLLMAFMQQIIAFFCVSCVGLALWPIVALALPISIPPSIPPPIALLFVFVYLPILSISFFSTSHPDKILQNTPRKSYLVCKPGDESRFLGYLALRSSCIALSTGVVGWITVASVYAQPSSDSADGTWYDDLVTYHSNSDFNHEAHQDLRLYNLWLIQVR